MQLKAGMLLQMAEHAEEIAGLRIVTHRTVALQNEIARNTDLALAVFCVALLPILLRLYEGQHGVQLRQGPALIEPAESEISLTPCPRHSTGLPTFWDSARWSLRTAPLADRA